MKTIIIGAGAAGLMAARHLVQHGIEVLLLERENRIGGRIFTILPDGFSNTIEAGAEFIHGDLPLTLSLLKEAGLPVTEVSGEFYSFENGGLHNDFGQGEQWQQFYAKANALQTDCTLSHFLASFFAGPNFARLRDEATSMAQGLDLADPAELSMFSIRGEWNAYETQFRPKTGYGPLMAYLQFGAGKGNFNLKLNQDVSHIEWTCGHVAVTASGAIYTADALIITASVGNLQQRQLTFSPEISDTLSLFSGIGFGQVIKIVLEFTNAFWENTRNDLGFLFTPDGITFWTQLEEKKPILTAWIGNGHTGLYDQKSDQDIIGDCLNSIIPVFGSDVTVQFLRAMVFKYTSESASGGGYSYLKPASVEAISTLNKGVEETIFFAGEALHLSKETATVESALQSGLYTATKIIALKKP